MLRYCRALAVLVLCCFVVPNVCAAMGGTTEPPKADPPKAEAAAPKAEAATPKAEADAPGKAPAAPGMTSLEGAEQAASGSIGKDLVALGQHVILPSGGHMGEQLTMVMGGAGSSAMQPGSIPSLPGIGLPSMSIGSAEDILSPVGGMSSPFGKDGFPPFFGDGGAPQPTPPQPASPQTSPQPMPQTAPIPQTAPPVVAPTPPGQDMGARALEGAWAASDGTHTLIVMFINGVCGFMLDGKQVYGPYTVQGNRLRVQFNNGQSLDVTFSVQGNTLRFSDGTVLMRQQMPNAIGTPTPQPAPGSAVWPDGATGPAPTPPQGAGPLEGVWATQLPNGAQLVFVITGNLYRVLTNGQLTETGTFILNGNRLEYAVTSGQAAGQRGVNTWQCNSSVLIMTLPNGVSMQFQRQQR